MSSQSDIWSRIALVKIMCNVTYTPITLTCDVVLPSYQYFLQYLQQTGMTRKSSSESDALNQFGKTIQMLILARMNGYYSHILHRPSWRRKQDPDTVMSSL